MLDKIKSLPLTAQITGGVAAFAAVVAAVGIIPTRALWIIVLGLLIAALLIGLFFLAQRVMQRRRAAGMSGQLSLHSSVTPRGLSDPAQRARLDGLRQNFQKGVDKFRAAGKDLYSLPWYLVVGEPGSGKTEAIRHCNVGFPPGMQDELQGAGGTINMNWWFTNYAVILDTAGRLMFEEVTPGTSSEWREFLNLLRTRRPNCPINGLILVIPSDSLIKDTADEIAHKASRIAQQFNTVQTTLDVRFPVFVLVTKTDLINGFREFFEHVKDPRLQHQMMGWSNPDSLDQQFRPDLVDQHLEQVVHRIRRRRLGLMQDPTPQGETVNGRRLDDVDALFALPASLTLLAPRLRRYLEMIFMPNEWSGKPLFLRGIYFTSAMREGSALDQELAEAIGVPVDSLPEGRTWERERAYFLRDLFIEKIFREKGLVTRATNTAALLRRQKFIVIGSVAALLVVFGLWSWIGARSVRESVGRERDMWQVAREGWQGASWIPVVSPEYRNSHVYLFNGAQEVTVGDEKTNLADYHRRLAELVENDIDVPWLFAPMSQLLAGTNSDRRSAQRIVFEAGVIKPLVDAARDKIENARDDWNARSSDALVTLVRLESMIFRRDAGLTSDELSPAAFFEPLGNFVYNDPKANAALTKAFEWTYLRGGEGRGYWPPRWLSGGFNLKDNRPIDLGLRALIEFVRTGQRAREEGFEHIKSVRNELAELRKLEAEMARIAAQPSSSDDVLRAALDAYARAESQVRLAMSRASESGLFPPGPMQMNEAYKLLVEETQRQSETTFKQLQTEVDHFGTRADNRREAPFTLATEIRRALQSVQHEIAAKTEGLFSAPELTELQSLDRLYLEKSPSGDPLLAVRGALYEVAKNQIDNPGGSGSTLIGSFQQTVDRLSKAIGEARDKAGRYQGAFSVELGVTMRRLLDLAQTRGIESLYDRYAAEFDTALKNKLGFPLLRDQSRIMTLDDFRAIQSTLRSASSDMPALRVSRPPNRSGVTFEVLQDRVERLGGVADPLLGDGGKPVVVSIAVTNYSDMQRQFMQQFGDQFRMKSAPDSWPIVRINRGPNQRFRTTATQELVRLPVSEAQLRLDFLTKDQEAVDGPAIAYTSPWAPLQLFHQGNPRRLPGGKDWEVTITVKREGDPGDRYAILRLTFEKPLPELEQWPTAARLGL